MIEPRDNDNKSLPTATIARSSLAGKHQQRRVAPTISIIALPFVFETGKVDPTPHTSSFNMGYLVSPYPYPNGAGGPIPVSMVSGPVMLVFVLFPSNLACLRLATGWLARAGLPCRALPRQVPFVLRDDDGDDNASLAHRVFCPKPRSDLAGLSRAGS